MNSPLRILFLSTSVGSLGSGLGGGVELTLLNIAQEMQHRGHQINIVAPVGSALADLPITQIPGNLQETAQTQGRNAPITLPADAVLANMWDYARQTQDKYDLLLNFAYDWLPFYLTPFFDRPIAHLVSMGSLTKAMDQAIAKVIDSNPGTIGVHSHAQAETFKFGDRCVVLGNGLDLSLYQFQPDSENYMAWVGRIAPEKGIEDAIAAVQAARTTLKIWGAMPDTAYWQTICQTYPEANISYEGFLSTAELQQAIGHSRGLLMTPKWIEAFGNVAIEALACGVPVIAYRRGGPAEIVEDGKTGWLVEPDSVAGLVEAMGELDKIDRHACRQSAETTYSMGAMGDRVDAWLHNMLHAIY
ncbi:MAG: glycosyltransferase family 4 protein [Drouetiella hepatica Uher 2000/2452]|uniref:Glycosyltransferase family 4 protein n=1 Tax=Drouetiella hepatica Uher 2000/2452 TaxID=904376 RepID=A0A951UN55_9CYAN|nr:glycosyltransferase family 4 protein [Drouetiella hepatica Uher 2000/2452]